MGSLGELLAVPESLRESELATPARARGSGRVFPASRPAARPGRTPRPRATCALQTRTNISAGGGGMGGWYLLPGLGFS